MTPQMTTPQIWTGGLATVAPSPLCSAASAHPVWALRAAPVLGSVAMVARLRGSRRTASRFAALLRRRLELPAATPIDWGADGRRFVAASPEELEARLLFLGAVANGPVVATTVSRLAVCAMVGVLGERGLRAAIALARLGRETAPFEATSPAAARARFAASAARHLGAWLDRQPVALRHRVLMALPPDSDLDPYGAAAVGGPGAAPDPDLIPTLAARRAASSQGQASLAA